jgi:hypothetical protein
MTSVTRLGNGTARLRHYNVSKPEFDTQLYRG